MEEKKKKKDAFISKGHSKEVRNNRISNLLLEAESSKTVMVT